MLIQNYLRKYLNNKNQKIFKNNVMLIFLHKIRRIFLAKIFIQFKKNLPKSTQKKSKKNNKKKLLYINTNIYDTNKISVNNIGNSKAKESTSSHCQTTKHSKIMSYVNYRLNLNQENNVNVTKENKNLNNNKGTLPFSNKKNSTYRPDIPLNKINNKKSTKKMRNKNQKNWQKLDKIRAKTLINNDIAKNNNMTEKTMTLNSILSNDDNSSKFNKHSSNISQISKINKISLPQNTDYRESSFKNLKKLSKEINPINNILKTKNPKNQRSNANKFNKHKMKKINTFVYNENKTTKSINSKTYENCINQDIKKKNKKGTKGTKLLMNQKKQNSQSELLTKNNINKKDKLMTNINKPKSLDDIDIKNKYFKLWKENVEKRNILRAFVKNSKYFNNMNHYEKIILIKNTIQKLINLQRKENIGELLWRMKRKIIINIMKKLSEFKQVNNRINNIQYNSKKEEIQDQKANQLKIILNKYKKNFNNNTPLNTSPFLSYFEKWKKLSLNKTKVPTIREKLIDLTPFQSKLINSNNSTNINNSDTTSLRKNLSLNKISPKIINVINVQNYNENNNYNYNFKYVPTKDIPLYQVKQRNSYNNSNENTITDGNNIYHKKKLGNTYINNNYNINFSNNTENLANCFSKKINDEDKPKYDSYDTSSLIIPFQNNNSEIISLEKNNILCNIEHPEEKFGFKKLDQIEEKEINFLENKNVNNDKDIVKLYVKKQNLYKKHIFSKKKTSNINTVKSSIKSLNIQFDNKNGEIIRREKNILLDDKLNKILSSENFFTESNYYENKNEEDKLNKSFNAEINSTFNDDFKITQSKF